MYFSKSFAAKVLLVQNCCTKQIHSACTEVGSNAFVEKSRSVNNPDNGSTWL